jgi:hypothetical protein
MRTQTLLLSAVAATLVACGPTESPTPEEPMATPAEVLPNIPLPPDGIPLNTEGSGEALQLLVSTPLAAEQVVEFYREVLSRPPYSTLNESTNSGATTFLVEQDGPSLWVTVQGLEAGGSLVRLAGAAITAKTPDSSTPAPAARVPTEG